jgi:vacuolar-type H+-ATPase subunit E/Vma4
VALEELLARLERDGRTKADAVLEAARAEARRVASESEERVTRRRRDSLEALEAELRVATERLIAAAREAARRQVLSARERMLDRVFRAAEERLAEFARSEAYVSRLAEDLAEARSYLGEAPAVVRCAPELSARVRAVIVDQTGLSVEEQPHAEPGFVLVAADGSVEVESTLTARLKRLRPVLSIEVLERLGGRP